MPHRGAERPTDRHSGAASWLINRTKKNVRKSIEHIINDSSAKAKTASRPTIAGSGLVCRKQRAFSTGENRVDLRKRSFGWGGGAIAKARFAKRGVHCVWRKSAHPRIS